MKVLRIIRDESEPCSCEITNCREYLNALNVVIFSISPRLTSGINVCDKHLKYFKRKGIETTTYSIEEGE